MTSFLYYLYERRLLRQIRGRPVPRHLGIILDGNRRYALERGFVDPCQAYALGARKLDDVLPFMPMVPMGFTNPVWVTRGPKAVVKGSIVRPPRPPTR